MHNSKQILRLKAPQTPATPLSPLHPWTNKQRVLLLPSSLIHGAQQQVQQYSTHPQFLTPYPHVSLLDYVVEVGSHGQCEAGRFRARGQKENM